MEAALSASNFAKYAASCSALVVVTPSSVVSVNLSTTLQASTVFPFASVVTPFGKTCSRFVQSGFGDASIGVKPKKSNVAAFHTRGRETFLFSARHSPCVLISPVESLIY